MLLVSKVVLDSNNNPSSGDAYSANIVDYKAYCRAVYYTPDDNIYMFVQTIDSSSHYYTLLV
jgi:hypothetical protein